MTLLLPSRRLWTPERARHAPWCRSRQRATRAMGRPVFIDGPEGAYPLFSDGVPAFTEDADGQCTCCPGDTNGDGYPDDEPPFVSCACIVPAGHMSLDITGMIPNPDHPAVCVGGQYQIGAQDNLNNSYSTTDVSGGPGTYEGIFTLGTFHDIGDPGVYIGSVYGLGGHLADTYCWKIVGTYNCGDFDFLHPCPESRARPGARVVFNLHWYNPHGVPIWDDEPTEFCPCYSGGTEPGYTALCGCDARDGSCVPASGGVPADHDLTLYTDCTLSDTVVVPMHLRIEVSG